MLAHLGDEAYRLVFGRLQRIVLTAKAAPVDLVDERYTKNQKRKYRKQKPCTPQLVAQRCGQSTALRAPDWRAEYKPGRAGVREANRGRVAAIRAVRTGAASN